MCTPQKSATLLPCNLEILLTGLLHAADVADVACGNGFIANNVKIMFTYLFILSATEERIIVILIV